MNAKPTRRSKCIRCGKATWQLGHAVVYGSVSIASGVYCFPCFSGIRQYVKHVNIHPPKQQSTG